MAKLTGESTMYYVGRVNTNTGDEALLRHNTFNGMFNAVEDFDQAKEFSTVEEAQQLAQIRNTLSTFMNDPYTYDVVKRYTKSNRVDENGEDIPVEEEPATEEPTQ